MKKTETTESQDANASAPPKHWASSPFQLLKSKRISYLTLPLLLMATLTEFVILATGWRYQQVVCLPKGMGVTFFGIGPIGATILAVELLKLPLAIWTASRQGLQKFLMIVIGLPLICVLTFQLVKDMAVYEMGVALAPASQMMEQANKEETIISQLNGDLAAITDKKAIRDRRLAELAAKQTKAKATFEDSLKRIGESRQDAISLTDYQKQQLSEVQSRESEMIKQFDADTAQLTKSIADLRTRREVEVTRATAWNAAEAKIDNVYKTKMADYANKKAAYEKAKSEYENANFLKRQLLKEPVDPGVPPVREENTILKPVQLADIDAQIRSKESELLSVNSRRREQVAQVEADANRLREQFDTRSGTKREEADRKREELLAAQAAMEKQWAAEQKQIEDEYQSASTRVDAITAQIDAHRKTADGFWEAREAAIKNTQVYRIATTVEIVRSLFMGQRPVSIKATARERGDLYTDQISMVRVWVYPVLAFIVAFLPTLLVEIGFSTIFHPEKKRPAHRLGFFGRRLHTLYKRAGRMKILRAERLAHAATASLNAREAALNTAIAERDEALVAARANVEKVEADKEAELQAARASMEAAIAEHDAQLQEKESVWVAKLSAMADSLNRTVVEKDALRDLQKSEIERQIQMRQNAWSDRLTQLRQELDDQRVAAEAERTTLIQEQHRKLMEVSEDCKIQIFQARRALADAEFAGVEKNAKLNHDLKEALLARDEAESRLKNQEEILAVKVSQIQEDAAREIEKASRQEKQRLDLQRLEFEKVLRQRDEDLSHELKKQEQELAVAFEARLVEEKNKFDQDARRREADLERQVESRARELEARWSQEIQQREEAAQVRLKQREQQLLAQADARQNDVQTQAEQEWRRRETELERQLDARLREADIRLRQELQQKEIAFHAKLKQREKELTSQAASRETELQNQLTTDLRTHQEELEREAESRVRAAETRLGLETQQKEEIFQIKLRQRENHLQSQFDARQAELQTKWDQTLRDREQEWERNADARIRAIESRLTTELQQKEELFQSKSRQRDEQWQLKLETVRAELQAQVEQEQHRREAEVAEAARTLNELDSRLRQELQQKEDAIVAKARQREQELATQLAAQTQAFQSAKVQWEAETKEKTRATMEYFKSMLDRTDAERDEARELAAERFRQVQHLEKKLTEASTFLNGWKNGKTLVETGR